MRKLYQAPGSLGGFLGLNQTSRGRKQPRDENINLSAWEGNVKMKCAF